MALTKLENMVNPQVLADMITAKLPNQIKFAPMASIDNTLEGRPGNTITMPAYAYTGDASIVGEGEAIPIEKLTTTTKQATIHKIAKGYELSDESVLSGYGDPMGEAGVQLVEGIASKIDNELLSILRSISAGMTVHASAIDADAVNDALVKFGEELDGEKWLAISPEDLKTIRKSGDWVPASEISAEYTIKGSVGEVYGCQVIVSNKVKKGYAYIVKPGALKLFLKRDTAVEADRDIVRKTTVITADKHETCYLYDETKAIAILPTVATGFTIGAETATILGADPATLQENISIVGSQVKGKLLYKTGYTGYSGDASLQSGNFFAFKCNVTNFNATAGTGVNVYVKIIGGLGSEVMLDADKNCVIRVANKDTQYLQIRVVDNTNSKEYKYFYYLDQLETVKA